MRILFHYNKYGVTLHATHWSSDEVMWLVVDSEQWKTIDRLYPNFVNVDPI